MHAHQEVRSLRRGLQALHLINEADAVSIAGMATLLKLPRTTTQRILNTLLADGYLERTADDKQYRLTAKVLALSSGFVPLATASTPPLPATEPDEPPR